MKTAESKPFFETPRRLFAALLLFTCSLPAAAHKASDAYLQIDVQPQSLQVRWDIALRDLDAVLPLDADGDRQLTWGEVRTAIPSIEAYALPALQVEGCTLRPTDRALERRSDGTYLALKLRADCAASAGLPLRYSLFTDSDATHRGIANLRFADGRTELRLLDPNAAPEAAPASFFAEGVHHIVTGYDHLLFLLCLVLPAVVRRGRRAVFEVAGIVTLFTLAHSTTLALAALGHARLPPAIVEPVIALTIVLAAIDNLRPLFGRWRGAVTFGFGLVHGFGFAGVLAELSLPAAEFGWALLRFNLGLEFGQLAILAIAAPMLHAAGHVAAWRRHVLQGGSALAAAVAIFWFVERSLPGWA
ncbi:HupE/UreJ family protein [Piscinibacter sp.]|uniref:HupE/UreJ family protein n=1 Tax=Piscinibacter sp. TaxID=1903157 RepID=UPI002CC49D6C|nr:HupE/UreJ family protein [Albitalea sp.]HUG24147.1 HupE/UreJ family protein [Albitalea sp.]